MECLLKKYLESAQESSCRATCGNQSVSRPTSHGEFGADHQMVTNLSQSVHVGLSYIDTEKRINIEVYQIREF